MNKNATGTLDGIGRQDHSITSEYDIYGPPGTGKTTELAHQVRRAVGKYGANAVLVTSFSRAAAAELAGHDLLVNPSNIGTLHSHCFYALGKPRIAEAHVKEWNRSNPHLAITSVQGRGRLDGEDALEDADGKGEKGGDALLRELNRYRGLAVDPNFWPARIRDFEQKWTRYKQELGLLDFSDLIDICLGDVPIAPGSPAVIFADEAQDLNAMQLRLVRKWSRRAEYSVLALDDDQTIYSFTGVSPKAMLDADIPDDHKVVLDQSHRVPRAVHRLANALIREVTRRQEKVYFPRPAQGAVHRVSGTYKCTEYAILSSALKHLERGKTIMFLASCTYMLQPIVAVLRKNAIPFHNPYRKANGFWNPLHVGRRTTGRRIMSLLVAHPKYGEGHRPWTYGDLVLWAEWLHGQSVLKGGAKELLQSCDGKQPITMECLGTLFKEGALASLLAACGGDCRALMDWWRARVTVDVYGRIQFPADVVARHGPRALWEEPRVVVGTIHSVKGGQADAVYLFPDLSSAGDAQYQRSSASRDSVIRLFYVGATRARETLYICQPATATAVSI